MLRAVATRSPVLGLSPLSPHSFANDGRRVLVVAESDELRVTQVVVTRPLDELELPHQRRLQPATVRHLLRREPGTPASRLQLRQVRERALPDLEALETPEHLRARGRR